MKGPFSRNLFVSCCFVIVTLFVGSVAAHAHPELVGLWKERATEGRWRIYFQLGQVNGNTWQGTWSGKLHHDQLDHPNGSYVLILTSNVEGNLTMYENGQQLCSAHVHLGEHHLVYGNAHYYRAQ